MLTGYDRMQRYIHDVKSGKILTNEWIKKAIKRHENDLKKSESQPDGLASVLLYVCILLGKEGQQYKKIQKGLVVYL